MSRANSTRTLQWQQHQVQSPDLALACTVDSRFENPKTVGDQLLAGSNPLSSAGAGYSATGVPGPTMEQLKSNIASHDLKLSDEVLAGIEAIHKDQPNPAP